MSLLDDTVAAIRPASANAAAEAHQRQDSLTKPPGALGALEALGAQLAAIADACPPPIPSTPAIAVFAGDHGVHAAGVTPWPQEVTVQMVANMAAGGAVVNALAHQAGASVTLVDVGVASPVDFPCVRQANVRRGTADLTTSAALTREEAIAALEVGISVAAELVADGADLLVGGEMGIANTTPAAAIIAALTGTPAAEVTGRGTGIDDVMLAHKTAVIEAAVGRLAGAEPLDVLARVGGLEHAALAGLMLGGAANGVPVIVDGVIAVSAALVAVALCPDTRDYLVAGHLSAEPGARVGLGHIRLTPLIDLSLRLGEGSGAVLAIPLVQSAARVLNDVATFDGAGVSRKDGTVS